MPNVAPIGHAAMVGTCRTASCPAGQGLRVSTIAVVGERVAARTMEHRHQVDELNVCLRLRGRGPQNGCAARCANACEPIAGPRFPASAIRQAGRAVVGGSLPVDSARGLKAKRHPPGTPGVAQCVELFHQFRGQAVNRIDGAPIALALNIGSPAVVPVVTTLEGPGTNGG